MDNRIRYVYKITCNINNNFYIGVSLQPKGRWTVHSKNSNSLKLNKDRDKFGWENFTKEIIFEGTEEEAYAKEIELIETLKPQYNNRNDKGGKQSNIAYGEASGSNILTENIVKEIREKYATEKYTQESLAKIYGVDKATIGDLVRGDTWYKASGPTIIRSNKKGGKHFNAVLSDIEIIEIRERRKLGETLKV